jgi:hypothetical protein
MKRELERMVVLVVMMWRIAGAITFDHCHRSPLRLAKIEVAEVEDIVEEYVIAQGRCPTVHDLVSAHYVRSEPRDPWGTPLTLKCPGEHERDAADVVSSGPDKTANTKDDIKSWEL